MSLNSLVSFLLFVLCFVQTGCTPVCTKIDPTISCTFSPSSITTLPSAFPPLSIDEQKEDWGKELLIGESFSREWDLYRAIGSFKRALILLPNSLSSRQKQIEYNILFAYYLGNKNEEVIKFFENSSLSQASSDFPAFDQLLLIVYDAYLQINKEEEANCVLQAIQKFSPETEQDLTLYQSIKKGDPEKAVCLAENHREKERIITDLAFYEQFAKSPQKARFLNAVLPGAGYYYVGQKKSAMTSFIINALFTIASYQFFHHGYPAAGLITASLEMGWYLGGINGAGIEANTYNTRLFESVGKKILSDHQCFPLLMFHTSF